MSDIMLFSLLKVWTNVAAFYYRRQTIRFPMTCCILQSQSNRKSPRMGGGREGPKFWLCYVLVWEPDARNWTPLSPFPWENENNIILILQSMFRRLRLDHTEHDFISCRTRDILTKWQKLGLRSAHKNKTQNMSCWGEDGLGGQGNVGEETDKPGDN